MYEPVPPAPPAKSNTKWIILALVLFLVVAVGAALIVAAGIGLYIYTAESDTAADKTTVVKPQLTTSANNTTATKPGDDKPAPPDTDKAAALTRVLEGRTISGFQLVNVVPVTTSRTFERSDAEVIANYRAPTGTVSLIVADYPSRTPVASDFGKMTGRERARKAKMTQNIAVKDRVISAGFETDSIKSYAFCNWPDNKAVLCHRIDAESAALLQQFRTALAGK